MSSRHSAARWTEKEDAIIRGAYPDYVELAARLPERSYWAIKSRARTLGVVKRRHTWTGKELKEIARLRRQGMTWREFEKLFPGLSREHPKALLRNLCPPPPPKAFGLPLLDAIRARAYARGLRLTELDRLANTGRYFSHSMPIERVRHIDRAARVLGGELAIVWDRED